MLRFVTVFFGFCITQIMATLKQPFRRSLMNRMTEFQLPKMDLSLNLLADWTSSLSTSLKLPLGVLPSADFIAEWTAALKFPLTQTRHQISSGTPQKMPVPVPTSKKSSTNRCVNSEVIIAIEAILFCMVPFAIGCEEFASPIAALELVFFAICNLGAKTSLEVPVEQGERSGDRNWYTIWDNVLSTVEDPKAWITSYFINANFEDLSHEDVHEFITWAMFTTTPNYLSKRDEYAVLRTVKQIETYMGVQFKPRAVGAPQYSILRPSIENLRWVHKPLLFYLVTQGVFGTILSQRMKTNNFVRKTNGKLSYWTNCESMEANDKMPIVMAHGIGGLCAYFDFVKALIPLDSPLIVLEIPSVSLHIAPNVPTIDQHVDAINDILDEHGFEKAVFVGHSFGSSIVSWVVQNTPERVAGSVFMDPVVFMLHLTDILKNWTYEEPVNTVNLEGLMDIVKTELFASYTVQRHFCWHRNILFANELQKSGSDSLVILSGADRIVPSSAVRDHLEKYKNIQGESASRIQSVYLEDAPHGGIIFQDKYQSKAIEEIGNLVKSSSIKWKSNIKPRPYDMKKKPTQRNMLTATRQQ